MYIAEVAQRDRRRRDEIPYGLNRHQYSDKIRADMSPPEQAIFDKLRAMDEALFARDPFSGIPDPLRAFRAAKEIYEQQRPLTRFRPPPLEIPELMPLDVQMRRPIPPDRQSRERIADEVIHVEISAGRATELFIEIFIKIYQDAERDYALGFFHSPPNPYELIETARFIYNDRMEYERDMLYGPAGVRNRRGGPISAGKPYHSWAHHGFF
jgi:hypothetical protein